ncbi:hypothetical protein ACMDB5_13050 [Flavobacterium sp. W1B]|uniref:hypothetical protein n=1 Tax=Flavobacterium sp. W1B TaxID=3394146 RepID=UPI0039BD5CDE
MVSFTQAQSLGFALNAGQSHVTSNQCMTKNEALAKYNLSASAMDSYASNQLVPRSVWVNALTYYTYPISYGIGEGNSATCSVYDTPGNLYSNSSAIALSMVFYSNTSLTATFPGGGFDYFYSGANQLLTINNSGVVTNIQDCITSTGFPFSSTNDTTGTAVCGSFLDLSKYSTSTTLSVGVQLFNDAELTEVFVGLDRFRFTEGNRFVKIDNNGYIVSISNCP